MVIIRNQCIYYILFRNISLWRLLWVLLLFKMCQMPVKLIPAENPGSPNQKLCYYGKACLLLLCAVMHQRQVHTRHTSRVPGMCLCVCEMYFCTAITITFVLTELLCLLCLERLCRDPCCTCSHFAIFPFVNYGVWLLPVSYNSLLLLRASVSSF